MVENDWMSSFLFVSKISGYTLTDIWKLNFKEFKLLKDQCIKIHEEQQRAYKNLK